MIAQTIQQLSLSQVQDLIKDKLVGQYATAIAQGVAIVTNFVGFSDKEQSEEFDSVLSSEGTLWDFYKGDKHLLYEEYKEINPTFGPKFKDELASMKDLKVLDVKVEPHKERQIDSYKITILLEQGYYILLRFDETDILSSKEVKSDYYTGFSLADTQEIIKFLLVYKGASDSITHTITEYKEDETREVYTVNLS